MSNYVVMFDEFYIKNAPPERVNEVDACRSYLTDSLEKARRFTSISSANHIGAGDTRYKVIHCGS